MSGSDQSTTAPTAAMPTPAIETLTILKPSFAADLARFGPQSSEAVSLVAARAYTRSLARSHYENFPVLTWVMPRAMRQPIADVYAFSRWADDLGDEIAGPEPSLALLDWWQSLVEDAFAGRATHPVFVALRESIAQCSLERQPFLDLISAFRQDQTVTRYQSIDQLRDYCSRSADPVGRLVLAIAGQATPENVADSDCICTALQLANFCQDVGRDAAIGRCYLPTERLSRHGAGIEETTREITSPGLAAAIGEQSAEARQLLEAAAPLAGRLPLRLGIAIDLFRRGGLAILDRVDAVGGCVLERRPKVGKRDAAVALARSVAARVGR